MPSDQAISIRKRARLIVGIDYGTTYSGLSFAMSTATDFKDIKAWTAYPGASFHQSEHCEKAPSLVSFDDENGGESGRDLWGYQVEPDMKAYAWTKLLLDDSARASEYDDPGLKKAMGSGMMKLPQGRTAKEIVTTYLRGLNTMYQGVVVDKFGQAYFDNLPVDFWLTVPATWSDAAKQLTIEAARDAGFASRPHDRVRLIAEPEAAAHLALRSSIQHVQDLIEVGARVMVCDLGGGTVDITSYKVQSISPRLRLRFGYVLITQEDMESLFDPVGDKIICLVADQVNRVKKETSKAIDHLVLVGGFGSSPYIKERLKEWCLAQNIRMTTPWSGAWSAVVCGAVLRGIEGAITTERRCRRHYGFLFSEVYDPQKYPNYDKAKRRVFKTHYSNRYKLSGFVKWFVAKNDILQADWNVSHRLNVERASPKLDGSVALFACSLDEAPDTIESDDVEYVGSIDFVLDNLDLSTVKEKRIDGDQIKYRLGLTCNLRVSDEDGLFDVKIWYQGKECGQGKIVFSYSVE
ncbi:Hypothetical protein NCS54_01329700 [Fusarium falciforme]|uniref:Hypothetical protein n=1 Tax=Fusarium falciforme TaxID=195108 RepID=UPI00230158AB|nr:Hypothetical protein NCS54_01329700 [Fusarium falciforme]WAO95663.1 Hypothetical protein NCS54_01329700 [Fusarium falciforme]